MILKDQIMNKPLKYLTTIKSQLEWVCEAVATVDRQDRLLTIVKVHPKLLDYFMLLEGNNTKQLKGVNIQYAPHRRGELYYADFFSGYLKYFVDDCHKSVERKVIMLQELLGAMQAVDADYISKALQGIPAYDTLRLNEFVLSALDLKK